MNRNDAEMCGSFVVGFGLGALLIASITAVAINPSWQEDAVKHGAAQYDTQTGKWHWKDKADEVRGQRDRAEAGQSQ